MTAHNGELGCFTEVDQETLLALPTGVVTVKSVMLAMHGVLVAWASSDLPLLPAVPGSSPATNSIETTSNEHIETSTTTSAYVSPPSSATSTHTVTATPIPTITESTTSKAESQISNPAADAASVTQGTLTPEPSSSPLSTSITSTFPSTSASAPPHSTHNLRPSAIAGISIGAATGSAILAGLAASIILFRRRRRRAKAHRNGVDFRVFDSASEFHEDKRRWSQLSSSLGTTSGSGSGSGSGSRGTDVSEADSRAVMLGVAELEGN